MSYLQLLGFAWAGVTTILVGTLIYRSLISMKEDDQLFLDPAESNLEEEQTEIVNKLNHLAPVVKGLALASGGLFMVMVSVVVYNVVATM